MNSYIAREKADALLVAGDALAQHFPAKSRELLRECRQWRRRTRELEENEAHIRKQSNGM